MRIYCPRLTRGYRARREISPVAGRVFCRDV
jgi:hypothetical protein